MPKADAGQEDHHVDLAGDQAIGEIDRFAVLLESRTSRMLGLTNGWPPNFSISRAISTALRLSRAATRRLAKFSLVMSGGAR